MMVTTRKLENFTAFALVAGIPLATPASGRSMWRPATTHSLSQPTSLSLLLTLMIRLTKSKRIFQQNSKLNSSSLLFSSSLHSLLFILFLSWFSFVALFFIFVNFTLSFFLSLVLFHFGFWFLIFGFWFWFLVFGSHVPSLPCTGWRNTKVTNSGSMLRSRRPTMAKSSGATRRTW